MLKDSKLHQLDPLFVIVKHFTKHFHKDANNTQRMTFK